MKWRDDLPDDWDAVGDRPPVDGKTVDPLLMGDYVHHLEVDLVGWR